MLLLDLRRRTSSSPTWPRPPGTTSSSRLTTGPVVVWWRHRWPPWTAGAAPCHPPPSPRPLYTPSSRARWTAVWPYPSSPPSSSPPPSCWSLSTSTGSGGRALHCAVLTFHYLIKSKLLQMFCRPILIFRIRMFNFHDPQSKHSVRLFRIIFVN